MNVDQLLAATAGQLRRPVLGHGSGGDAVSKLGQLAADHVLTPGRVVTPHAADEVARVHVDGWAASGPTRPLAPEQPPAGAMPPDDGSASTRRPPRNLPTVRIRRQALAHRFLQLPYKATDPNLPGPRTGPQLPSHLRSLLLRGGRDLKTGRAVSWSELRRALRVESGTCGWSVGRPASLTEPRCARAVTLSLGPGTGVGSASASGWKRRFRAGRSVRRSAT